MSATRDETGSILIAALGGEGGGVLAGWITDALWRAGLYAQGTSIPGVAQRTGATTYYIEYCRIPLDELGERRPVLALNPVPGRVDVMVASEIVEAARAVQNGLISPDRTTMIASAHRVFATPEKIQMGDGRFDTERALKVVHDFSKRAIVFDMNAVAERTGTVMNSILLGALAGSGALPVEPLHFEDALKASGKAVEANMAGYRTGFDAASQGLLPDVQSEGRGALELDTASEKAVANLPLETRFIAGNGFARCMDYQDQDWAEQYLACVFDVADLDRDLGGASRGWMLTNEAARHLALRMTYEDVMRVADLKTRPDRLAGIRAESMAGDETVIHVTDYLKPGPEELCALLPERMGQRLLDSLEMRGRLERFHVGLHLRADTLTGHLMFRLLARMKALRRKSWRHARECDLTRRWIDGVCSAAKVDYAFGVETARCADLVKGYGSTYRRGVENFERIFSQLVEPAIQRGEAIAPQLAAARTAALADPEGTALDGALSTTTQQRSAA
ncbi:indolepyruvate oxidoreductase subunit beta family protein [Tepidamorphus sp. 3E244]|uniref:indolepyruvate oxidoreductase subunit beta family protein n=1 Tax=Tepidamorphus sp. 3E244 TaxID=3385498 RepID=UPI0038FC6434